MVGADAMTEAMRGLYVNDSGSGDDAGDVCGDREAVRTYEWAVVTNDSGTLGGVGGSGDKGDEPNPVRDDGGVIDAIEANMAAVLVGVAGIGVELPPTSPGRTDDPFINPPIPEGLGLAIPLLGGLIRFSF